MFSVLTPSIILPPQRLREGHRLHGYTVLSDRNPGDEVWRMYARQWGIGWAELWDKEPEHIGAQHGWE